MLLYFGPEVMMPLASAAAAALGAILMFWRRFVGGLKAALRSVGRPLRRVERPAGGPAVSRRRARARRGARPGSPPRPS